LYNIGCPVAVHPTWEEINGNVKLYTSAFSRNVRSLGANLLVQCLIAAEVEFVLIYDYGSKHDIFATDLDGKLDPLRWSNLILAIDDNYLPSAGLTFESDKIMVSVSDFKTYIS
jgi:hypothetical protein